jgi:hypothetical protein
MLFDTLTFFFLIKTGDINQCVFFFFKKKKIKNKVPCQGLA